MRLGDVMDEIADAVRTIPTVSGRTYAWPVQSVTPPCAFIPFPEGTFDLGYQRGADELDLSVVVLVSAVDSRASRDAVLAYMSGDGVESVKAAVEGATYTAFDSVRVESVAVEEYFIGDIPYIAMVFPLDIIGSGTTT